MYLDRIRAAHSLYHNEPCRTHGTVRNATCQKSCTVQYNSLLCPGLCKKICQYHRTRKGTRTTTKQLSEPAVGQHEALVLMNRRRYNLTRANENENARRCWPEDPIHSTRCNACL